MGKYGLPAALIGLSRYQHTCTRLTACQAAFKMPNDVDQQLYLRNSYVTAHFSSKGSPFAVFGHWAHRSPQTMIVAQPFECHQPLITLSGHKI